MGSQSICHPKKRVQKSPHKNTGVTIHKWGYTHKFTIQNNHHTRWLKNPGHPIPDSPFMRISHGEKTGEFQHKIQHMTLVLVVTVNHNFADFRRSRSETLFQEGKP